MFLFFNFNLRQLKLFSHLWGAPLIPADHQPTRFLTSTQPPLLSISSNPTPDGHISSPTLQGRSAAANRDLPLTLSLEAPIVQQSKSSQTRPAQEALRIQTRTKTTSFLSLSSSPHSMISLKVWPGPLPASAGALRFPSADGFKLLNRVRNT